MDCGSKCVIQAVAGSGKTQHLIDKLDTNEQTVIIAYTNNNQKDIRQKVLKKFNGELPPNIHIFGFWTFVYSFCLAPFLGEKQKGICFETPPYRNTKVRTNDGRFYSNKISKTLVANDKTYPYIERIDRYFSRIFIDEVQDIGGDDLDWLLSLSKCKAEVLAVGDFYQGTFQTSSRGNKNKRVRQYFTEYKNKLIKAGFNFDTTTLNKSYRCTTGTCDFIRNNLEIEMYSAFAASSTEEPILLQDKDEVKKILVDKFITKLFYRERTKYACAPAFNWGEVKGLTCTDICVILPKNVLKSYKTDNLKELAPKTKAGFYVACTRANGKVFFVSSEDIKQYKIT